jgi:hypothetical protein
VDPSRISFGEMIAAVSGLVLFIVMFLPWYGVSANIGFGSFTANAWESFDFIDIVLFLVALLAVGMAVARAAGAMPSNLPAPPGQIVAAGGALAVLLILYRLIDTPGGEADVLDVGVEISRKAGVFLGLLAAGGVTFGGYTAMKERATGQAPPVGRRRPPAA